MRLHVPRGEFEVHVGMADIGKCRSGLFIVYLCVCDSGMLFGFLCVCACFVCVCVVCV